MKNLWNPVKEPNMQVLQHLNGWNSNFKCLVVLLLQVNDNQLLVYSDELHYLKFSRNKFHEIFSQLIIDFIYFYILTFQVLPSWLLFNTDLNL